MENIPGDTLPQSPAIDESMPNGVTTNDECNGTSNGKNKSTGDVIVSHLGTSSEDHTGIDLPNKTKSNTIPRQRNIGKDSREAGFDATNEFKNITNANPATDAPTPTIGDPCPSTTNIDIVSSPLPSSSMRIEKRVIAGNAIMRSSSEEEGGCKSDSEDGYLDDNVDVDTIATIRTSNVTSAMEYGSQHSIQSTEPRVFFERQSMFTQIQRINNNNNSNENNTNLDRTHHQIFNAETTLSTPAPTPASQLNSREYSTQNSRPTAPPIQQIAPQTFTLPPELRRILYEVSKTGKCSSLPWNASSIPSYFGGGSSTSSKKKRQRRAHRKKKQHTSTRNARLNHNKRNELKDSIRRKIKRQRDGGCSSGGLSMGQLQTNNSNSSSVLGNIDSTSPSPSPAPSTPMMTSGIIQQHQKLQTSPPNLSSLASSASHDAVHNRMILQQQKHFNEPNNGGKQQFLNLNVNDGRFDKKIQQSTHSIAHSSSMKGEDGDVSSLSSTLSHTSKKSSTAGTTKHNLSRLYNRDFINNASSYASSCSESISSKGEGSTISMPSSVASIRTLRGALRYAVVLVLDHSYKNRGGYKLSPAEKRRFEVLKQKSSSSLTSSDTNKKQSSSPNLDKSIHFDTEASVNPSHMDVAFIERRTRIIHMLGGVKKNRSVSSNSSQHNYTSDSGSSMGSVKASRKYDLAERRQHCHGPPFTIQRVAEVLLMSERYYSQTHKLCNALEKLLLVRTPSSAFGGVKGGDTSQNRQEEQELAAFEDKKVKDETEQRQRILRRRKSTSSCDSNIGDPDLRMNVNLEGPDSKQATVNNDNIGQPLAYGVPFSNSPGSAIATSSALANLEGLNHGQMLLLAGATGSPETLVASGIYQNVPSGVRNNDTFTTESNISRFGNLSGDLNQAIQLPNVESTESTDSNVLLPSVQRPLSPSLLMLNGHHPSHADLQSHHSPERSSDFSLNSAGQRVPMEMVIAPATSLGGTSSSTRNNPIVTTADVADLEGRSSASNSDIDSESDDVSFDDSASDRSDGSDSGYFSEPFTAARVLALNRMQQQHRREQYLQDRALRQLSASSTNFQPPPDSEYQSGDSIDSTMAEDSCGSDSSSSDFAD